MKKAVYIKHIILIIVLILSLALSGCQLSPEVAYDNFITDLDVIYRFEEIAFNVEFGRYSNIFQSDIRYLILDLTTFDGDDEQANAINDMFIRSAKYFLSASQSYLEDQPPVGDAYLGNAKAKYNEALSAYYAFIIR